MSILLDVREHGLIGLMGDTAQQQLAVGDAWICDASGNPLVVVERKTTADFEASFLDGRYREQRTRLLAFCAEKKARPLYVLEGGVDGRRRSLGRDALQKLLHRLMLRYGVAVWHTTGLEDTAGTLKLLAAQVAEDPKVFEAETVSYTDVMHTQKKANTDDPKVFAVGCLQVCPGVSANAAKALVEAFGGFQGVLAAEEKALADTKVGARKLGPVVAKRLWGLLHSS
jgi:ERCC4-type nuclease